MRRILLSVLLAIGSLWGTPVLADGLCASIPITSLPPAPLSNANLQCDSAGNLKVNVTTSVATTPYNGAYGQTIVPTSWIGIGSWSTNGGGSGFDAWTFGPSTGPSGGLGLPLGTPGVPYIQGIGPYGTVPISGTLASSPASASATPTITASSYTAGYEVGGLMTFSSVLSALTDYGALSKIVLTSKSVQTAQFKLYVFSSNPSASTWTDHVAPSINVADIPKLVGVYTLAAADTSLGTVALYNRDLNPNAAILSSGVNVYCVLVTTGTPTFASTSDLTLALTFLQ
jgi:hypothetical protein